MSALGSLARILALEPSVIESPIIVTSLPSETLF